MTGKRRAFSKYFMNIVIVISIAKKNGGVGVPLLQTTKIPKQIPIRCFCCSF